MLGERKTFKRELAVLLLLWLAYVVEVKGIEVIEVIVWPVFSFVTAAFGFDAYGKLQQRSTKSSDRGRPERSSQRTGREDQQSDDWYDK